MPHSQLPNDHFTIGACLAVLATAVERVPHKVVLSVAAAVISVLVYWGFTNTFKQFDFIRADISDMRKELRTDHDLKVARDHEQDRCLSEIKTYLKSKDPKAPIGGRMGGGDFGDK